MDDADLLRRITNRSTSTRTVLSNGYEKGTSTGTRTLMFAEIATSLPAGQQASGIWAEQRRQPQKFCLRTGTSGGGRLSTTCFAQSQGVRSLPAFAHI